MCILYKLIFLSIYIFTLKGSCGDGVLDPTFEQCNDGNKISGDGCNINCEIEENYKCTKIPGLKSECYYNQPFSAYLNYIPITEPFNMNLSFTKPLKNYSLDFLKPRLNISVEGFNKTDFNWTLKEGKNVISRNFIIEIYFGVSFQGKKIIVGLIDPKTIYNIFGESLGSGSEFLISNLPSFILYSRSEKKFMDFMKYFIWLIFGIMLFCFLPLSILNSLTVFWSFLDCVQLMHLLLFVNANYTQQFVEFLRALRIANFQLDEYSKLFIINSITYIEIDRLPSKFIEENYGTRFFQNVSIPCIMIVASIVIFLLIEFLCIMINSNLSKFGRILSIIRKRTKYSLILRSFLIAYTPMTFFTIVQLHNLKFVETGNIVDSSFCILSIIYLFVFPLVIFIILNVKKYNLEDEEIKSKFYTIYDSLQTNAIFKKNFILFYLMRKILWPLFIIIYLDDPLYQIFGLICLSVTIITLLILKKPYKSKVIFREFVLNELLVLSVLILISTHVIISYLDSNDMDLDLAVQIGWILVGLVSSLIFIKLIFMVYSVLVNISLLIVKAKKIIKNINMETIVEEQIDSKDKELDQPTFIEMGNFSSSRGEVSVNRSGHQFMYPANPHLKPTMIKEKIVFEDSDDDDEYN